MARDLFSNQGSTAVSSGGTTGPPSQGTTESWTVASSSTFPAASNAASPVTQFYISDPAAPSETILVTNVSGTTWSVTRGADGTTPVLHTAGFTVRNVVSSLWLTEIEDRVKTIVFNVLEYGADPTGAADSQPAFQAAANAAVTWAAANKRGTVLIPQGSYKLNSAFKVVGGNVTVNAYGAYIFAGAAANDLFRDWTTQDGSFTLNGQGLQVLGGTWDMKGHTWAQAVEGSSAFTISNSSNILFRDLTIRNVRQYHGIDINTCSGVTCSNVRVEGFKNSHEWKTIVGAAPNATASVVVAATTGNITLSAPQTIDGVAVTAGQRVLVKSQTAGQDNGLYQCNAGAWTRTTDMNTAASCNDAAAFISGGTTQGGMSFYQTATIVTLGTTVQTWTTYYLLQCKLASTANLSLTGAATVDGTAVVTADRILVKNQTLPAQNGIYAANTAGAWNRVTDADTAGELNGKSVYVSSGTANGGNTYKQSATIVTINTDAVTFGNEFRTNRYFSEAIQIDNGPNAVACTNITVDGCYMGPATDGSGLLSFGKMAGTHTDSSGQFYTNMKFVNNTSVNSLSNAFQGYSFADSIIANNLILGSGERGIRMFFNSGNSGPRLNITNNVISQTVFHGIEIDGGGSQLFSDVNISGNTITSTAMTGGAYSTGIHVDTCNQLIVANNTVNLSTSTSRNQGIFCEVVTGGTISGNHVTSAGTQAIQIGGSTLVMCSGNTVVNPLDGGIYVSASSTSITISDNYVIGANQSTTSENGGICVSTSANTDILVMGNRVRKGTGTSTQPFKVDSSTVAAVEFNNNSVASDWTSNSYANYSINGANTLCKLTGSDGIHIARLGSDLTGLVATTLTNVTGLSAALPIPGKYRFKVYGLWQSSVTTASGLGLAITAPASPTLGAYSYSVQTGVGSGATNVFESSLSSPNLSKSGAVAIINTSYGFQMDGWVDLTASGTLQVQYSLGVATACKIMTGTVLIVERIA